MLVGWLLAVCAERMFSGAGSVLKTVYTERADGTYVKENRELDFQMGKEGWIRAAVIAGTLGLVKFLNGILRGDARAIAIVFAVVLLAGMIYLMFWFHDGGSNWKEVLVIGLLMLHFFLGTCSCVETAAKIIGTKYLKLLLLLPKIVFYGGIGFLIVDALFYHYQKTENNAAHIWSWIVMVATAILILALIISCFFSLNLDKNPSGTSSQASTAEVDNKTPSWFTKLFGTSCAPSEASDDPSGNCGDQYERLRFVIQ
jgi:hypothetical protein